MAFSAIGRWASKARASLQPWHLLNFSNSQFERIDVGERIEEETLPDYAAERYYPVHIGELLASRYQVVGKLGYGVTSTVWLARDLMERRHVALKIFIHSSSLGLPRELLAYQRLEGGPKGHPGRLAVRTLLDSFIINGPDGEHQCLVHPPLWDNVRSFLARNPIGRLPLPILAVLLRQLLQALDYARECQVIHTDIKASNIMFGINDATVFEKFEQGELNKPTPRKEIDGRTIYTSRTLELPRNLELPVLCDFGAARWGDGNNQDDVQPDIYRSPEVILKIPWSHAIDIWNVGCMIWDIFEGRHLFSGIDPENNTYRSRAHLAELIAILGPPLPELVARGELGSKFFSDKGEFQAGINIPPHDSLDRLETNLDGSDKILFLQFVSKMLQWDPQKRHTPGQLLEDEWLKKHTSE